MHIVLILALYRCFTNHFCIYLSVVVEQRSAQLLLHTATGRIALQSIVKYWFISISLSTLCHKVPARGALYLAR